MLPTATWEQGFASVEAKADWLAQSGMNWNCNLRLMVLTIIAATNSTRIASLIQRIASSNLWISDGWRDRL
jgi:hypothetical protein